MKHDEIARYMERANAIKRRFFGHTKITFHEPMMRMHDGPYHFNGNTETQSQLDEEIDTLVAETDFVAFGVGVRKQAFQ